MANGALCPGGRAGFDVHPSFNANPQRLASDASFVQSEFLPRLKALALCQSGVLCRDPSADRMTFVDAHQPAFADHGFCARAPKPIPNSIRPASRPRATASSAMW